MSSLSLAAHPPLPAGAGQHRFSANNMVCALTLRALVLRARFVGVSPALLHAGAAPHPREH